MEKQILELLFEMKQEMQNVKSEISEMKNDMNARFDKIEYKLDGIGHQFEITNELRMNEYNPLSKRVDKLEKDVSEIKGKKITH